MRRLLECGVYFVLSSVLPFKVLRTFHRRFQPFRPRNTTECTTVNAKRPTVGPPKSRDGRNFRTGIFEMNCAIIREQIYTSTSKITHCVPPTNKHLQRGRVQTVRDQRVSSYTRHINAVRSDCSVEKRFPGFECARVHSPA